MLDASAIAHETIYVSAGRRGLEIELDTQDLMRLTGAEVRAIARRPDDDPADQDSCGGGAAGELM